MSTKKTRRPSSPRRFFARLYGHLEATKKTEEDEDEDRVRESLDSSPEITEEAPHVLPGVPGTRETLHASHSKNLEETSGDVARGKVSEEKGVEKDSMLAGIRLPFLHGFFPRPPGHPLHLTQLAHPPALPPHLHGLPGHHPMTEHHFQGFSAFRYLAAYRIGNHPAVEPESSVALQGPPQRIPSHNPAALATATPAARGGPGVIQSICT
ncbi:hypothetical protein EAI_09394 [Harpegnathos saltator]|uniref:Uncharacterized protein n=1 Tax=Harpegnathos saltator TaxID=610380 RepID=E2BQH7_HARSA|nr:hypothetical protein EAI_09394 [Harpegnathos saltator]